MKKKLHRLAQSLVAAGLIGLPLASVNAQRPLGIDTSHWNGTINWGQVFSNGGYRFVFQKGTESTYFTDSTMTNNVLNAKAAGLQVGVYHFARPLNNTGPAGATNEANWFVSKAGQFMNSGYLPPVLDLEVGGPDLGASALSAWANAFCNRVKQLKNVNPIIYCNVNYAQNYLNSSVTNWHLWIAQWPVNPDPQNGNPPDGVWPTWKFWQYTDSGTVPGISGSVDLDVFNGTGAQLTNFVIAGSIPPPTITQHPSAQNLCAGATATFSVTATGEGTLTYQWQTNNVNISNNSKYGGATSPTLWVTNVGSADARNYRCVVANAGGSVNSSAAALTLKAATTITQQPSNRNVAAGGTTNFTVAATGDGTLTYQWQKNQVNLSNGGHYSGVTTATLTISNADANDAANYRCVVTGGCGTATSFQASLTVGCSFNPLLNPSFELGAISGVGTNWTGYQRAPNPATTTWSLQTASPPSGGGTKYQQIANSSSTGGGGVRQNITGCTVGATYRITGWMRGNSLSYSTCRVRVSPSASTSWSTAVDLNPPAAFTGNYWVSFNGTVVATSTNMTLWLDGQTTGSGQFKAECFDAIVISCP